MANEGDVNETSDGRQPSSCCSCPQSGLNLHDWNEMHEPDTPLSDAWQLLMQSLT